MSMKIVILSLLMVVRIASIVVTSTQYFDRMQLPNWGTEVTFYGLGLIFSWPTNFTKTSVSTLADCKWIFRVVVPSCLTAFAEKQSNGTVLCTYFKEPIYELPTINADKRTSFAFYKDIPILLPNGLTTNVLLENRKFYFFMDQQKCSAISQICHGRYPNGNALRTKTYEDFNLYFKNPKLTLAVNGGLLCLDLLLSNDTKPILQWGDGTPYNHSEFASLFNNIRPYWLYNAIMVSSDFYVSYTSDSFVKYYAACEVNPFSGPIGDLIQN